MGRGRGREWVSGGGVVVELQGGVGVGRRGGG